MEKFVNDLKKLIIKINSPIDNQKMSFQTKEKIITLTEKIFLNSEEKKFQTILINYIIKPIYPKFTEIENLKQSTFSRNKLYSKSISKYSIIEQHQQVKPLIEYLFENYKHFLKEEKEYIQYKEDSTKKERDLLNLIFKNIDYDINYSDARNLKASKNQVLKFLNQLNTESNYIDLRFKVTKIHTKIKEVKNRLTQDINRIDCHIKDATKKINSDIDYHTDYWNYTYKEIIGENLVDNQFEHEFYTNHFKLINNLQKTIERKFPFVIENQIISQLVLIMPHEKTDSFLQIEDKLIECKYLIKNEIGLEWNKKKNELVNFCRFIELEKYLKPHKKLSTLVQFLEDRYKINVGDQRKESKFNGTDEEIKSNFEFLKY